MSVTIDGLDMHSGQWRLLLPGELGRPDGVGTYYLEAQVGLGAYRDNARIGGDDRQRLAFAGLPAYLLVSHSYESHPSAQQVAQDYLAGVAAAWAALVAELRAAWADGSQVVWREN